MLERPVRRRNTDSADFRRTYAERHPRFRAEIRRPKGNPHSQRFASPI
jgi:ribosomal protein L32E